MCGISGYITTKKYAKIAKQKFTDILLNGEGRGADACGIAFSLGNNRYEYIKAPLTASKFIQEKSYIDFMKKDNPTVLIGHNRAKTQGDQANNKNNHPIVTKTGLMLIHNGIVSNDLEVIKDFKLEVDGLVDSEVIVRLIEYYKLKKGFDTTKAIRLTMQKLRGTFACALLDAKEPHALYLWRSSNPINLAFHKPTGIIYFASTEDILENGLADYKGFFKGLFWENNASSEYIYYELPDDRGIRLTAKGFSYFEIKTKPYDTGGTFGKDWATHAKPSSLATIPSKVEASTQDKITEAVLDQAINFEVNDIIKKPSEFVSELLLYRLEYLQDLFVAGEDERFLDEQEVLITHSEIRRILDTLKTRQYITKRKLYIPTMNEIITRADPHKVKYILSDKNKKLFEILKKNKVYAKEDLITYPYD